MAIQASNVLLVGQAPSRESDPGTPLGAASGGRLAAMLGLTLPEYLERYPRMNLMDFWPGYKEASDGDEFDPMVARAASSRLLRDTLGNRKVNLVILMGKSCARAVGIDWDFLELGELQYQFQPWDQPKGLVLDACAAAVFPHPSGVSHYWRSTARTERAQRFLRGILLP